MIYEETPTQKSTYLYLNQQLMARVDHETAGNQLTYYHTDLLGSPIAASNNQGNLLWEQDYKPYGERLDKGKKDNRQWYTGKTEDKETGFIYLNARHYDPEMARFISPDPVYFTEQNTQSFNRYTYANNNPYLYKDPDGKAAETVFDAISLGLSIQQFARDPSWGNFGAMMFDGAATAIPFVPGGMGVARRAMSSIPRNKALTTWDPPNMGFLGEARDFTLIPGAKVDRFGFDGGHFLSPQGTPGPMRALRPGSENKPYRAFEVMKPIGVKAGEIAPAYGQPGLGTQFVTGKPIRDLINGGFLRTLNR